MIFCIRFLAFAKFDCAASACLTRSVVLDGVDAKVDGSTMFSVDGVVDDDEDESSPEEEEPPPKKPPKAMLMVCRLCVDVVDGGKGKCACADMMNQGIRDGELVVGSPESFSVGELLIFESDALESPIVTVWIFEY